MSDSGFDISLLEGKDRAELAAIAESLGQKPGARAKKSDIVALIMRLVGADDSPTPDASDAAESPEAAAAAAPESAEGDTASESESDGEGERHDEGSDHAGDTGASDGEADGAPPSGSGGRESSDGHDGGGDSQAGDDGEVESGNRRRRRRGRDRDRRPDGEDQQQAEPIEVEGMVDLRDEGYGFLRLHGYLPSRDDAYISVKQTRQFGLRTGDMVTGKSRPPARNEKNPALLQVETVNGFEAHNQPARPRFDELTAVFPGERLALELPDDPTNATVRLIDLLAPIGKGTRGLVVAPPKAGTTSVLKDVIRSLEVNHPDVEVIALLVAARPEDVTDMKRWLLRGSVAASTFDRPAEEHASVAELVIERAKRLVEGGKDVVVVLDGITRLTRAYNAFAPASGRTLAGGLEASALYAPKRVFGAARNAEEGGSLTILATAAVETGSAIDDAIFDEMRSAANLELRLDGHLAGRRAFPAVDIGASSARHEELLFDAAQGAQVVKLRQVLADLRDETGSNAAGFELLREQLDGSKTNAELLAAIAKR